MLWELRQIMLVAHILLAVSWVGGVFFMGWGVYPALRKMAYIKQQQILLALMQWSHKFLTAAGIGVIITGILLGTVFGPVSQWDDIWHTTYGNTWMAALIIGIITLLWGVFIGYRQAISLFLNNTLWEQADSGHKKPLKKALTKTIMLESPEVGGFIVLIILMVSL